MKAINANSIMKFVERFEELAAIKKKELNITLYLNAPMLRYAMEKFPVHEVEIVQHGRWIKEQLSDANHITFALNVGNFIIKITIFVIIAVPKWI